MVRPWLIFVLCVSLMIFAGSSKAETMAERLFGQWESVKIENILKPVPLLSGFSGTLGAVARPEKTEKIGCPIYELNKVIGWSMSCGFPSAADSGKRQPL